MKFTIFKNNVVIRSCFIEVILSQEFLEMRLLVIDGIWLIIDRKWLECLFTYSSLLFGFLYR